MDQLDMWAIYFSSVVSWQFHPGNACKAERMTLIACAAVADEMLRLTMERKHLWERS